MAAPRDGCGVKVPAVHDAVFVEVVCVSEASGDCEFELLIVLLVYMI